MTGDTEQRTVLLTDEVWAATHERAALEGTTASDICQRVLSHYLALEEKPPRYDLPAGTPTRQRSIHVLPTTWAAVKAQKVLEGRSISAIVEQLLRAYLGFPLE